MSIKREGLDSGRGSRGAQHITFPRYGLVNHRARTDCRGERARPGPGAEWNDKRVYSGRERKGRSRTSRNCARRPEDPSTAPASKAPPPRGCKKREEKRTTPA